MSNNTTQTVVKYADADREANIVTQLQPANDIAPQRQRGPTCCHDCTPMERRLTLVAATTLLAAIALAVSLGVLFAKWQHQPRASQVVVSQSTNQSQEDLCLTQGCIQAASEVLSKLDPSADPCDDFYQYACGNYVRTTNIPDDKSSVDTISALTDHLLEKLRNAIEEELTEAVVPRSLQLARDFYRACMNKPQIESRGVVPLQRVLQELGGWPAVEGDSWDEAGFDWRQSVYRFRRAGFSTDYFIKFSVETDHRNSTQRCIYLDRASPGLSHEFLLRPPPNKQVDAYYKYQVDLAVLLGGDRVRAQRELRQSLEFERHLAIISLTREKRGNVTQPYEPPTVEKLQRAYPSVQWLEFLQALLPPRVTVSSSEAVVVLAPSYIERLLQLLSHTPKSMPLAVGSIYVRRFFDKEAKNAALEMVDDIRQEFLHMLQEVDWMDEGTKKKALDKAKSMVAHIAYPDELLDDSKLDHFYEELDVNSTLYLESLLNVTKFLMDCSFGQLRQPINKTSWTTHGASATVNAFYDPSENSILFPAGILQGAFFSADRPKYLNYGGIGFIIGHEITHGFDDKGRRYDKDGNVVDWWDPVTRDKFLKKARCIISQYGNLTDKQTGMHLNGLITQGENIADNGGIKEAYRAYLALERRTGQPELRLPALPSLSPRQMFWVSVAQAWCSKYRVEQMRQSILTDVHPPSRFRILGPFSNQPEFAKDFECPPGCHMNPKQKCQVW
ncbi:neprilysin-2-like isoform X4 [Schistocerca nitens]|uniref:neprilysin-2-like isoform X4 n=1 Tax=Schistocerca nitens TaxID=7011 RepID=UPI0021179F0E|nr:neprilysin-2-like isoform X4 [Schistocerca nitens]